MERKGNKFNDRKLERKGRSDKEEEKEEMEKGKTGDRQRGGEREIDTYTEKGGMGYVKTENIEKGKREGGRKEEIEREKGREKECERWEGRRKRENV